MKRLAFVCVLTASIFALTGCQAVFTYSPLAFLQRDPATLPEAQQIERAQDVLVAGTSDDIAQAYQTISGLAEGSTDPGLNLLAAELAFAASGVTDVITGVLEDPDIISSGTAEDIDTLLASLDTDLIAEGASFVQTAAGSADADISDTQYIIAGAGLLLGAVEESGGFEILETAPEDGDPGYDDYQDAMEFFTAGGLDDFSELFSF